MNWKSRFLQFYFKNLKYLKPQKPQNNSRLKFRGLSICSKIDDKAFCLPTSLQIQIDNYPNPPKNIVA